MANSQAMCTSYKVELLKGIHAHGTTNARAGTGADSFKLALYYATASLGASTTAYSSTGEVSGSGYTAGGTALTNGTAPNSSGTTAFWTPSASAAWTTFTSGGNFDCALLYNDTASGDPACTVHTFAAQNIVAGDFTLTMPTNDASNALLRIG